MSASNVEKEIIYKQIQINVSGVIRVVNSVLKKNVINIKAGSSLLETKLFNASKVVLTVTPLIPLSAMSVRTDSG